MSADFNFDFDAAFAEFDEPTVVESTDPNVTAPVVDEAIPDSFKAKIVVPLDGESKVIFHDSQAYSPGNDLLVIREEFAQHILSMTDEEASLKAMQDEIERIRTEAAEKIYSITIKKKEIETALYDKRKAKRDYERRINVAEHLLRQALENEKIRKDYISNAIKFDQITAGFKWREFAFEHQIEGAKLMATAKKVILGDKMGLGKSLTSLIFADMVEAQKILIVVPDDVVMNFKREVEHWAPHRKIITLGRRAKAERNTIIDMLDFYDEYIVVINYSAWRKDQNLLTKLIDCRFDTIIMDEAHSIKETTTSAYKGCARLVLSENSCPKCRGRIQKVHMSQDIVSTLQASNHWSLASQRDYFACIANNSSKPQAITRDSMAKGCGWTELVDANLDVNRAYGALRSVVNVVPMTGTVILNKPTDIFALLSLIDDEKFTYKKDFEYAYCETGYDNKITFKPGGMERLAKQLSGKYVARDRHTAGVTLPKQEITVHSIEMDRELYPAQYKVIQDLTRHAMLMLDSGKNMPILATIALITRKRQANVWPAGINFKDENGQIVFTVSDDVTESIKLDRICTPADRTESKDAEGLIPELTGNGDFTNGERVVVFSQFKQPLAELENRIKNAGISVVRFDGDTPDSIRDQVKIDFDRKYCDVDGYEKKWQVVLCNYKTGGVGLNFTSATQMIILDEEWNGGKADQAYGRIDRMGQTAETTVHILRLERTIDTWMSDLIDSKRAMVGGFEAESASLQDNLLNGMRNGDMI